MSYYSPLIGQQSSGGSQIATGYIGERLFAQVTEASKTLFTPPSQSYTTYNITSLTLTGGTWAVTGWGAVGATTTGQYVICNGFQIVTSSSGWTTPAQAGGNSSFGDGIAGFYQSSFTNTFWFENGNNNQTVYLNTQARYFFSGQQGARFGWILAERIA